jgi:hypothetical protein
VSGWKSNADAQPLPSSSDQRHFGAVPLGDPFDDRFEAAAGGGRVADAPR